MDWRARKYANKQRDLDWYEYLRRQADVPISPGIPYGKIKPSKIKPARQGVIISDDEDIGISKIDFTSPPVTLTWLDIQAKAPPQDKGIKRTLTKSLCPWKEVSQSKILLRGGNYYHEKKYNIFEID